MEKQILRLSYVVILAAVILFLVIAGLPERTEVQAEVNQQFGYSGPVAIIQSAQTFSTTWVDLGSEIDTERYAHIGLFISLTISDSTNVRARALAKRAINGANEYYLPINTMGSSNVVVEDEYIEFTDDADQDMLLAWDLDNIVPVVQFQIQVSDVGTTAGQIESAYVTRGY